LSEVAPQAEGQPKQAAPQSELEKKVSNIIKKIFANPVKVMVTISSIFLAAMMLLVTADVTGRYVFKTPVKGSDELVGLLLLCVAACAFSYTQQEKRHIRIDILIDRVPRRARLGFDIFNYLFSLGIYVLITRQIFIIVQRYINHLQTGTSTSEILHIPWTPFLIIMGLGFAILSLVMLSDMILTIVKVAKR
jgi:TRAP-type transport system small permease protein